MAVNRPFATGQTSKESTTGASFLSISDPQYVTRFSGRHLNHEKAQRNKLRKSAGESQYRLRPQHDRSLRPYSDPSARKHKTRRANGIAGNTATTGAQVSKAELKSHPETTPFFGCIPLEVDQRQGLPSVVVCSPSFKHQGYRIVNGAPSILSSSPDSSMEKSAPRPHAGQDFEVGKLAPQLYVPFTRPLSKSGFFDLDSPAAQSERSQYPTIGAGSNASVQMYLHGNNSTTSSFQPQSDASTKHKRMARKLDHSIVTPDNSGSTANPSFTTGLDYPHQFAYTAPQLPFIALGPRFSPYEEVSGKPSGAHHPKTASPAALPKQRFSSPASLSHSQTLGSTNPQPTASALFDNISRHELKNPELMLNAANVAQGKRAHKRTAPKHDKVVAFANGIFNNGSSVAVNPNDKKLNPTAGASLSKKPLPKIPGPDDNDSAARDASQELYHGLFRADVPTIVPTALFDHLLQPPHVTASTTSTATYETQLREEIKEREQLLQALLSEPQLPMACTPPSTNSAHCFGTTSVKYSKQKPSAFKRCGMALKVKLTGALCS